MKVSCLGIGTTGILPNCGWLLVRGHLCVWGRIQRPLPFCVFSLCSSVHRLYRFRCNRPARRRLEQLQTTPLCNAHGSRALRCAPIHVSAFTFCLLSTRCLSVLLNDYGDFIDLTYYCQSVSVFASLQTWAELGRSQAYFLSKDLL